MSANNWRRPSHPVVRRSVMERCESQKVFQIFNLGELMKLRPLADRVIVKRLENETKTASGIVIPDTPPRSPTRAKSWPSAPARRTTRAKSLP